MKTVTIEYWDGMKERVMADDDIRYFEITPGGTIYGHKKRPKRYRGCRTYAGGEGVYGSCLQGHAPIEDGLHKSILLKIEEV